MNNFCFIKISPSQLPGPEFRERCDPKAQLGPNCWEVKDIRSVNLCFRKISPAALRNREKEGKSSSTWSSQASLPSKYKPVPMLLYPKWPDFSLLKQISGKRIIISGWKFHLNLFEANAHLPFEFCQDQPSSMVSYRGQTRR